MKSEPHEIKQRLLLGANGTLPRPSAETCREAAARIAALEAENAKLAAEVERLRDAVLDLTPWEHSQGPVPDYESPLMSVFDSGVTYTIELLVKTLGVPSESVSWDAATETHDGDVGSVIYSALTSAFGEDWPHALAARPEGAPE